MARSKKKKKYKKVSFALSPNRARLIERYCAMNKLTAASIARKLTESFIDENKEKINNYVIDDPRQLKLFKEPSIEEGSQMSLFD